MQDAVETPVVGNDQSKTSEKTQKETFNTREWIEMRNETKYWKGIIRDNSKGQFNLVIQEGELTEIANAESTQKEEVFAENGDAIKKMHELIKEHLASGYVIQKSVK
jgi:predicted DNA-binding WGR domain protein